MNLVRKIVIPKWGVRGNLAQADGIEPVLSSDLRGMRSWPVRHAGHVCVSRTSPLVFNGQ